MCFQSFAEDRQLRACALAIGIEAPIGQRSAGHRVFVDKNDVGTRFSGSQCRRYSSGTSAYDGDIGKDMRFVVFAMFRLGVDSPEARPAPNNPFPSRQAPRGRKNAR